MPRNDYVGPTEAQIRAERREGLRVVKRIHRELDTRLERVERRIDRILENKKYISKESAQTLIPLHRDMVKIIKKFENGLADFLQISLM